MHEPTTREVPVLIIGGGPVGLSAALLLAHYGVRSLLVERHAGTSLLPKARVEHARTMEVFRQCGIERAVQAAGLSPEQGRYLLRVRALAGEELDRREVTNTPGGASRLQPHERLYLHAGCAGTGATRRRARAWTERDSLPART